MPVKKNVKKVQKKKTGSKKASAKKTVSKLEEKAVEKRSEITIETPVEEVKKTPEKAVEKTEEIKESTEKIVDKKVDQVVAEVKKEATKKTKKALEKKSDEKIKKTTKKSTETKEQDVKEKEPKKTTKKTVKKSESKKTTSKKTAVKKDDKSVKLEQYNNSALDTCIDMAKAMGVDLSYDDYANMLLTNSDVNTLAKELIEKYDLKSKVFSFDEDGFDSDVIEVLLNKVANTVEIQAKDFVDMSSEADEYEAFVLSDEGNNNEEYHKEFELVKRLLMLAQRKDIHSMKELEPFVKKDMTNLVSHYMDVAYAVLKNWQYEDIKYYENFIYAVLSQFSDLYEKYENRAMMDVADLYIAHGDYGLGDANYGYILRENAIKDYIYYRFANAYMDIDREKARSIAQSALQYVDDRFTYYLNIIQILEG